MDILWQEIYQSLLEGKQIVVANIVSHSGSTPRAAGSKMLIYSDGRTSGTIGGGAIEGNVIKSAMTLFISQSSQIKSYNLNDTSNIATMDLICGGQMQVLLEYIKIDDNTIEIYRSLNDALEKGRSGLLLGRLLRGHGIENLEVERSLQVDRRTWIGPLRISAALQAHLDRQDTNRNTTSLFVLEDHRYVVDFIISPKTVYLIGAGHVAKEVAPLAYKASFRTVVVDDRAEFANRERFSHADSVSVCSDCSRPLRGFLVDENSYIIIVTRGHSFDKEALAQALGTKAGYIGMIGSRKKRDRIYQVLMEEGFTTSDLERVHCPIGLSIEAETPFEIGISIIAELIKHRAKAN